MVRQAKKNQEAVCKCTYTSCLFAYVRVFICEGLGTRFCPYWLYCGLLAGAGAAPHCRGRCPDLCSVYCCFVFFVHSLESVYNAGTFCKLRSFSV